MVGGASVDVLLKNNIFIKSALKARLKRAQSEPEDSYVGTVDVVVFSVVEVLKE